MNELERIFIKKWQDQKIKDKNFLSKKFRLLKNFIKKIFFSTKNDDYNTSFSGWGMKTTFPKPPWVNSNSVDDLSFISYHNELKSLVNEKKFFLSQFYLSDTNYEKILEELKWRSYIIYNSIICSINLSKNNNFKIVECGVCDGLTIFYALSACKFKKVSFKGYLYDSFNKMRDEYLDIKDIKQPGNYNYLNIEQTQKNLQMYENDIIFNKGYIPEIFLDGNNPTDISWLHIDLNSAKATLESLEFFFPKIIDSGVVIFDDYGSFDSTREIVDNFLKDKQGHFINFPTGQSMFIKKSS
jgi:hypothetical protein